MARETAGALANRALKNDSQDAWDMAKEWTKDIIPEVWKCIDMHKPICPDKEFCVVMLYADDSLIPNCIRRKFYAWPWMPKPRPRQTVWLYRKESDDIQGLWSLPEAETMARLATDGNIPKEFTNLARWCRSYFRWTFSRDIRKEYRIDLLTEEEYNARFLPDFTQPVHNNSVADLPNTFDFSNALGTIGQQVYDPVDPSLMKNSLNLSGKAKAS